LTRYVWADVSAVGIGPRRSPVNATTKPRTNPGLRGWGLLGGVGRGVNKKPVGCVFTRTIRKPSHRQTAGWRSSRRSAALYPGHIRRTSERSAAPPNRQPVRAVWRWPGGFAAVRAKAYWIFLLKLGQYASGEIYVTQGRQALEHLLRRQGRPEGDSKCEFAIASKWMGSIGFFVPYRVSSHLIASIRPLYVCRKRKHFIKKAPRHRWRGAFSFS
jgi:hypothetical protein